jgi:hypothetical protein
MPDYGYAGKAICDKYDIICSNRISNRFTHYNFADISSDTCPASQIKRRNIIV